MCPSERNAFATAAPDLSETSRSVDEPPSMTVMFNLSLILIRSAVVLVLDYDNEDDSFANNFHFRLQLNSTRGFGPLLDHFNQRQHIFRRRVALVHNEIAVHIGHGRAADARAFQSKLVNQFA